ncbi:hypothetical protein VPH5P1C_0220 [Vibrio phage 5P1c]|nr:conserved hypothetical protein [Vibrio phage 495E54-1]CAH9014601.1 conserved hypothetical protein [Vibrio phage 496E54-1]
MLLSNKYRVVEDTAQITLYLLETKDVLDSDKKPTGETKVVEKVLGFFSRTAQGRVQAYNRLINCEISGSEKQDLTAILDIVSRCEEQVKEFWEVQ